MATVKTGRDQRARPGEVEALLESLSTEEKRTALASLGGLHVGSLRSTEEVDQALLESGHSKSEIAFALRRAETTVPKKHCLLGKLRGDVQQAVTTARSALGYRSEGFELTLAERLDGQSIVTFTIERSVQSYQWIPLPDQTGYVEVHGKKLIRVRHAMIARVDLTDGRALVTYRGLPIGDDYDYEAATAAALKTFSEVGIWIDPLPVRGCINALIGARGRRVLPIRGDLITPEGEIKLRSRAGKASIEQIIARLLESPDANEGDESALLDRITENIGKHTFETIGLLWADEKILTRVQFWSVGADFLFVWGRNHPSFFVLNRMIALLYELTAKMGSADFHTAWDTISDLSHGSILLPNEFRNRFSLPADETDAVVVEAVKAGLLEPVYMLNADDNFLEEIGQTEWTTDLVSLRKFHKAGRQELDGSDPESIKVAFRRMRFEKKARQ